MIRKLMINITKIKQRFQEIERDEEYWNEKENRTEQEEEALARVLNNPELLALLMQD